MGWLLLGFDKILESERVMNRKEATITADEPVKKRSFAPNDRVEQLRPLVGEFWALIFGTSYATSFVSDESTLDSREHYVYGGKESVIKRIKWFYGVDVTPYYNESIVDILFKIKEKSKGKRQFYKNLPAAIISGTSLLLPADQQHLLRAYEIPAWPDYEELSLETVLLYIFDIIIIFIGIAIGKVFSVPGGFVVIGIVLSIMLFLQIVNFYYWLINIPIRSEWEQRVGEVISLKEAENITQENREQWLIIGVPKAPPFYSFGTYANFGGGWDSLVLLNTHSSERYVLRGSLNKVAGFAKRIKLAFWD